MFVLLCLVVHCFLLTPPALASWWEGTYETQTCLSSQPLKSLTFSDTKDGQIEVRGVFEPEKGKTFSFDGKTYEYSAFKSPRSSDTLVLHASKQVKFKPYLVINSGPRALFIDKKYRYTYISVLCFLSDGGQHWYTDAQLHRKEALK